MDKRFLVLLCTCATSLSAQITSTWTAQGDGTDWFDPLNWSNGVPGFQDTALFDGTIAGDGFTIDISAGSVDIDSLIIQNSVETGPFIQGDSSFNIATYASVDGGGIYSDSGNQLTAIDGNFDISGFLGFQFTGRDITNNGEIAVLGNNQVVLNNSTLDNQGIVSFSNGGSGFNSGGGIFNNAGGVLIREGSNTGEVSIGWDVNNEGSIVADTDDFRFNGNFSQTSGDLIVNNQNSIIFNGGTSILGGGLLGDGTINNSTGSILDLFSMSVDPLGNPLGVIENGDPATAGKISFDGGDVSFDDTSIFFFDIYGASSYDQIEFLTSSVDLTAGPDTAFFGPSNLSSLLSSSDNLTILSGNYTGAFAFAPNGSFLTIYDSETFAPLGDIQIFYNPSEIQLTNFTPVPEPRTWVMLGLGAVLIGCWARRRLRRA